MKKALSILLSVVLLLGMFTCLTIMPASVATATEYTQNFDGEALGDFRQVKTKSGDLAADDMDPALLRLPELGDWGGQYDWGYYGDARQGDVFWNNSDQTGEGTIDAGDCTEVTTVSTKWRQGHHWIDVEEESAGGNKYLKVLATTSGTVMGLGAVDKDSNYTLTFKVKKTSGQAMPFMWITSSVNGKALHDINNSNIYKNARITDATNNYTSPATADGTWQEGKISFSTGNFEKAYWFIYGDSQEIYIDDIKLEKTVPATYDGTFDTNDVNDDLRVTNQQTWPVPGKFGINLNQGYYRGIDYDNEYYYNNAVATKVGENDTAITYQAKSGRIESNGFWYPASGTNPNISSLTEFTARVAEGGANDTANSVYINVSGRAVSTAIALPNPETDYIVSFWVKDKGANGVDNVGILSTLNVGDVNTKLANADSYDFILAAKTDIDYSTDTWRKVELSINSGALSVAYLSFSGNAADEFYIDEIQVSEVEEPAYTGSYEEYKVGKDMLTNNVNAYPANGYMGANKNAGYFGQTFAEENPVFGGDKISVPAQGSAGHPGSGAITTVVTDEIAHGGTKSLKVHLSNWVVSLALDVTPNTNYTLKYYVKAQESYADNPAFVAVASTLNTYHNTDAGHYALGGLGANSPYVASYISEPAFEKDSWKLMTHNFNSGDMTKVYLAFSGSGRDNIDFYLDDLTLEANEYVEANFKGAAVRSSGANSPAIRFRYYVDKAVIDEGTYNGGTVKEVSFMAIRETLLGERTLIKNGVYGGKSAMKGTAYTAETGKDGATYADGGDQYIITAALYNMGNYKDGTSNFDLLGAKYAVRPYIVVEYENGVTETFYDQVTSYSLFDVMDAVREYYEADSTNAQYAADYANVNAFITGDKTDKNGKTVKAAFDAWAAENGKTAW